MNQEDCFLFQQSNNNKVITTAGRGYSEYEGCVLLLPNKDTDGGPTLNL